MDTFLSLLGLALVVGVIVGVVVGLFVVSYQMAFRWTAKRDEDQAGQTGSHTPATH